MRAFTQAAIFHWTNMEYEINTYALMQLIVATFYGFIHYNRKVSWHKFNEVCKHSHDTYINTLINTNVA